jgi:hypothetical protein
MAKATKRAGGQGRRILNVVPSSGTHTDWPLAVGFSAGALQAAALPPSVDLREAWWGIGNQGSTGSCVGWATADGVMRYLLVAAGKLKRTELLSPRYVWMASKETDTFTTRPQTFIEESGTSLKAAADICRKYGVALDADLPFVVREAMFPGREDDFYARCAQRKAASYFNAGREMGEWKKALAARQPILAGLTVDANWMAAKAATATLSAFKPLPVPGGHAVCIVGYRTDGSFIVRNSWGKDWGDGGFAYVTPDYVKAAFFPESYVLTV